MLLAIDVGNSETTLGIFEDDDLVDHWRVATRTPRTADEHHLLLDGLLRGAGAGGLDALEAVAVCSVVPRTTAAYRQMARRYFAGDGPVFFVVEPGVKTGVPILTDHPREVGADRIVNVVAAFARYGGPAVVVDFGTATTFDVVSAKGEYLGGAIAPGVEISMNALAEHTAQLAEIEFTRPRTVIGKNTVECLQSGIVYGVGGQVDAIVRRMIAELGGAVTVVATGGLAATVIDVCETVELHDPWLTLTGLRMVYLRNAQAEPSAARAGGTAPRR